MRKFSTDFLLAGMAVTRLVMAAAVTTLLAVGGKTIAAESTEPVSLATLLEEMVDRSQLARFPSPKYSCKQFSSYDRRSTSADEAATWFANWDRSQFVRIEEGSERTEYVLMDADGPGAIVRIWSTWHGPKGEPFSNGTLRIYLDGSETPVIEGPIAEVIDGGYFPQGPLSQGVSPQTEYRRRGHNLYLPIPYARGCKVTYETDVFLDEGGKAGEALYYQINYRTYEPGTPVETFSQDRLAAMSQKLAEVQQTLDEGGRKSTDGWQSSRWDGEIPTGETKRIARLTSPGAIRRISLQLGEGASPQSLRSTIVRLKFDGEPCVWVPVGDFFGVGYKPQPYQSWYTAYAKDGTLSSEWVMPFEKECEVSIENLSQDDLQGVAATVYSSEWDWDERSMHFCASWREYNGVQTEGSKSMDLPTDAQDLNYVSIEGKGVYAGDTLTLFNGADGWWGEGDEKIYVDGEDFPSHFGTGTEDYYGYAWCRPESFAAPFHAQPEGGGNLTGGFSVNSRYRALDAIPFTRSLHFDMELWHWKATKINYAPTTFYYARPGAMSNVSPDADAAEREVALDLEEFVAN